VLNAVVPYLNEQAIPFKIAKDELVLEYLNSGRLGATQVGKFITIYPRLEDAVQVAESILDLTSGFEGPRIPSDLHLGGVLYTRYGPFTPIYRRDRLGLEHLQVRLPNGSLIDDSYMLANQPPPGVFIPFDVIPHTGDLKTNELFGPGYRILSILHETAKGSSFVALDMRSQDQLALHFLKQGRCHYMSDRFGRDVRWRLQREFAHHQLLAGIKGFSEAKGYFEVDGNGYLALEYIEGVTIDAVVDNILKRRPWASVLPSDRSALLRHMLDLIDIVAVMHMRGLVHRDISASNVIVDANGSIHLFDLEMAHAIDDDVPTVGFGTTGFVAPGQQQGDRPSFADDLYSVACIIALTITGIDPRRLLYTMGQDMCQRLAFLTGEADDLKSLLPVLVQALQAERDRRPSLMALRDAVQLTAESCLAASSTRHPRSVKSDMVDIRELLISGIRGLTLDSPRDNNDLFLSMPIGQDEETISLHDLKPLHGAYRGMAGSIYLLAKAFRAGYLDSELILIARNAAKWLVDDQSASDAGLVGLHAGEEGVVVALTEGMTSGLLASDIVSEKWIYSRLSAALDWPDVVHGAAGQGLAALICTPELSHRCARYLMSTQEDDGSWRLPAGFHGLSGQKLTGFAHGVAGIVYFLAEYAFQFNDTMARRAWQAGANWLIECSIKSQDNILEWPYSDEQGTLWRWWCHGGPGIALAFLRLAELSRDSLYLEQVLGALALFPPELRHGNLSLCHGMSGLGEIYLETYRVTGVKQWQSRAIDIARTIGALGRRTNGIVTWLAGNADITTAELYLGTAGILHFLLRLVEGPERHSFPFLPPPVIFD
jgi:serine/threonine protein kinase